MKARILKLITMLGVIISGIALDQFTKALAKKYLSGQPPIIFWNDLFRLQYIENKGAFLGMGSNLSDNIGFWILSILPFAVIVGILVYLFIRIDRLKYPILISLTLIFAGGTSNIVDRIFNHRHVIDFINVGIGPVFRSGILNLADLYITAGAILLLFTVGPDKKQKKKGAEILQTDKITK